MKNRDIGNHGRRQVLKLLGLGGLGAGLAAHGIRPLRAEAVVKREIIKRTIPSSGEQVPAIGLGTGRTMDVGSIDSLTRDELKELSDVVRLFYAHGARLVDTSPMYGTAEELVGQLASELDIADELFMATKVWTQGAENGKEQMLRSMQLLHSDPVDLMQIHNLVDWKTHYKTLRAWKEEGRIRYIGITHYRSEAHEELERILKSETFDFTQFNYNVLDRHAEKRLLPFCRDNGIATLINEPFEKGNMFQRTKGKALPEWAGEFDAGSWAQVFLKFIIAHPAVTCPIPATSDPKHVVDNVTAAYGKLPDESQRQKIVSYVEGL